MKNIKVSALVSSFNFRLLAVALLGAAFLTGCSTTSQIERGPESTVRVAEVGEAPGVAVFGGDMNLKDSTAASITDIIRNKGFTVVPSGNAARYEVRALWRVSSGVDGQAAARAAADPESVYVDAYTREARLSVKVVDLQDKDKTVYEGTSWPVDTQLLGPAMVRSSVDTALSNL